MSRIASNSVGRAEVLVFWSMAALDRWTLCAQGYGQGLLRCSKSLQSFLAGCLHGRIICPIKRARQKSAIASSRLPRASVAQLLDIRATLIGIWLDTTHAASMWSA